MGITKYNKGGIDWGIETKDFEFHSLEELDKNMKKAKVDHVRLYGLFINPKSQYGASPVAIIEDGYINLPNHMAEQVQAILQDADVIEDIKAGKCGIKPRTYEDEKHGKGTLYTAEFCDIIE